MASVLVPVAYVILVFGSLYIFSHYYRKRLASQAFEPYFPPHLERNTYITLLGKTDPPTPDPVLKAALVRRAVQDVLRVMKVREDKPALQNLLQKGSVGDDLMNSLVAAEKELEGEVMEVVREADSFLQGWGQLIFQTANEVIANDKMRVAFEQIQQNKEALELKYGIKAKLTIGTGPPPPGAKSITVGGSSAVTPSTSSNELPTSQSNAESVSSSTSGSPSKKAKKRK